MAFLEDVQLWSFRGQAAARRITETSEWEQWFPEETIVSIEPILDSEERFVDIGGSTIGPITILLAFEDAEARATFQAMRGTTGTLSSPSGFSRTALLRSCQWIASGSNDFSLLSCTFEAL